MTPAKPAAPAAAPRPATSPIEAASSAKRPDRDGMARGAALVSCLGGAITGAFGFGPTFAALAGASGRIFRHRPARAAIGCGASSPAIVTVGGGVDGMLEIVGSAAGAFTTAISAEGSGCGTGAASGLVVSGTSVCAAVFTASAVVPPAAIVFVSIASDPSCAPSPIANHTDLPIGYPPVPR